MKGKKFYIALVGLIIIGIGSIVIYRQQQETRALEFEGYEITSIESRVAALFNNEKTDIQKNISVELVNLEQTFLELNEKDLSNRTKSEIKDIEDEFLDAKEMYELQGDISDIFVEKDILRKDVTADDIKELQSSLEIFEDRTVYYNRNNDLLTDARVQIETIEEATELVEQLLIEGSPKEDIDEEKLKKLEELVNQIKDEAIKDRLLERIENVRLVLKEAEEELALDDEEDLEKEPEETIEEEDLDTIQDTHEDTEQTDTSPSQSNNQANNNQSQTWNNNRAPSTQTENGSNNQSSNQNSNQSRTSEQRPAVANKYQETQIIEELPYETLVYENKNITAGEEIVYIEGSQGVVTETYEVTVYKNGTSNRKFISRDRVEPVDRVVTIGTKEPEVIEE